MRYFHCCAHEQFPPDDLLRQAVEAEEAGFDGIGCSDHLQPWWEPGESGHAWVWLGAAGNATRKVPLGTGVTPPGPRYHPVLIAQAWATLERLGGRPDLRQVSHDRARVRHRSDREAQSDRRLVMGGPAIGDVSRGQEG